MTKRHTYNYQARIERLSKQGRGQGTGPDYQPWTRIQDKISLGLVSRVKGSKTSRAHQIFDRLEMDFFLWHEWQKDVIDIREHFPLDIAETMTIAAALGLRHPRNARAKQLLVMTTDFLITRAYSDTTKLEARAVMSSTQYKSKQLSARLEIEQCYWEAQGVEWKVVTELDVPRVLARNVELLHTYRDISDRILISCCDLEILARALTKAAHGGTAPLREITQMCDRQFDLVPGTSLTVVLHLIATRRWEIDINVAIQTGKHLQLLSFEDALGKG